MINLEIIANNIRSAENIGALFRTADALGVAKIWLAGYSPNIDHPKVKKTALDAQTSVASEHSADVQKIIDNLKSRHFLLVGLELDPRAIPLSDYHPSAANIALLLGNEVEGIPQYLRDQCDVIIYLPQHGIKESLNVTIAAAIASYELLNNAKFQMPNRGITA